MNKLYTKLAAFGLLLGSYSAAQAQMVGDCVFLKGNFVEVGVAPNGGYGSTLPSPAGYHPNLGGGGTSTITFWDPAAGSFTTSPRLLGFVADVGADGWATGAPGYIGDYYLPGTPQEGWAIMVGGSQSQAYIPSYTASGATGYAGAAPALTGTNFGYSVAGPVKQGVWKGTKGALAITQTTKLDTTKLYFTIDVVIRNTTSTPQTGVYYIRTVDPDNEQTNTGSFTTINEVTYQLPNPENKVLVSATGTTYAAYLGLGTKDCRAKCMFFNAGLAPSYPLDVMYAGGTPYSYVQGATSTADVGICLEFNIGTIAANDSTRLSYAYILNATQIDSALNSLTPVFTVNGVAKDSTDTINLCTYPYDSVLVKIVGGDFYHWSWGPDSFLTDTVGSTVVIHSDSISSDITYTITGTNSAGGCNTVKYYLTLLHGNYPGPTVSNVSYCQNETPVPLIPAGPAYKWYLTATGGVGTTIPPIPNTSVPGTTTYWVTQDIGLCVSDRSPETVWVKPLPPPPALSGISPYCQGAPFTAYSSAGADTILWYATSTGGTGSTTSPTVPTGVPGSYTFWASSTIGGCEGPRSSITTVVLDSILPSFTYVVHQGCHGDTVIFTNTSINATRYLWAFGDGSSDTVANPVHVFTTQGTFHTVIYGINAACMDSSATDISLTHPLDANFTAAPLIVCQGLPVTFTNSSVGTSLSYRWLFGNGATSTASDPTYTYANTGVYTAKLIATDLIPCSDTASQVINVDSLSQVSIGAKDTVMCQGVYTTFTGTYTNIGYTGVSWLFGESDSMLDVNPVQHAFNGVGTFTVSVTPHYRACEGTTVSKVITVLPQPTISLGEDTSICAGSETITLHDYLNAGKAGATWKWSTGSTSSSAIIVAPGIYYATVNINNCYSTDTVVVNPDCYMNIPNVFTPNGDGINDFFYPRSLLTRGLTSFNMNIYNRWGQLVFETTSLSGAGWDGKMNGVPQLQGVYIYVIDATFRDGQKEHHQGNVTLMR